jgi:hypothetical protein
MLRELRQNTKKTLDKVNRETTKIRSLKAKISLEIFKLPSRSINSRKFHYSLVVVTHRAIENKNICSECKNRKQENKQKI